LSFNHREKQHGRDLRAYSPFTSTSPLCRI
jgi:hypothetical protein